MVCITRTIHLHHRACCLHHTYNLFVRQSVRFVSHIQFICTTERAVCNPHTIYLHDMKCGMHHTHNYLQDRACGLPHRACDLHHTHNLFAGQAVWFSSRVPSICAAGPVVCIMHTIYLHHSACCLRHVQFCCTTGRAVCITYTIYLHYRACCLHHTYTLFARQGVWFASYVHFICTTGRTSCGRYGRCVADQR